MKKNKKQKLRNIKNEELITDGEDETLCKYNTDK